MEVILFYALLIGGGGLGLALIVGFLFGPIPLLARRFGSWAGVAFAFVLGCSLVLFYEPPYGGLGLGIVPPGMRPMIFFNGWLQDPPIRMLLAAASVSAAGFVVLLLSWLARRA
jgi:hypothetical protein